MAGTRRAPREWTDAEIAKLTEMRSQNVSFERIGEALGIKREGVRKKYRELTESGEGQTISVISPAPERGPTKIQPRKAHEARSSWTESELRILREGYEKGETVPVITERLKGKRSRSSIYAMAHLMGLTTKRKNTTKMGRPAGARRAKDGSDSWSTSRNTGDLAAAARDLQSARDARFPGVNTSIHHLAGLTPYESSRLTGTTIEVAKDAFIAEGWTDVPIHPRTREKTRREILQNAEGIIGLAPCLHDPQHVMVVLALCAHQARRNLVETARLAVLPLPFVERVFARLDCEGVWPVTDDGSDDLTADDYRMFADICTQEFRMIARLGGARTPDRTPRAAGNHMPWQC